MRRFHGSAAIALVAILGGAARADDAGKPMTQGTATVLQTFSKVVVDGNLRGPQRVGNETGAGIINAHASFKVMSAAEVLVILSYTRSDAQKNNNDSYMQGGVVAAKITETGVEVGTPLDLPNLQGDRPFQRPLTLISDDGSKVMAMAASEDNGINNNPQPVAFVLNRNGLELALAKIPNSTRGNNINKPTNLIVQALKDGIRVPNATNQRGPHSNAQIGPNTWAIGMQYNNQAHEGFSVTLQNDGAIKMNWLERYSNNAQHCRPMVAYDPATKTLYSASVEADQQPAEIGWRLAAIDPATGKAKSGLNKVVVKSEPKNNKYVAEPHLAFLDGKPIAMWTQTSKARATRDGNNGHAGGGAVAFAAQFDPATLAMIDKPLMDIAPYGRHPGAFVTNYGPEAKPALVVIGGSSTGTGPGKQQVLPLTAEGKLGVRDLGKMYTVSQYSDVANLSSRGNNNPNNQAKGFINGLGDIPNPGFEKAFMPEVKTFTLSAVTGYSDVAARDKGIKLSLWLSLVPATWKVGLQTVPGQPTDKPGANADGSGPMPTTTTTTPTIPDGDKVSDPTTESTGSVIPSNADEGADQPGGSPAYVRQSGDAGCSASGQTHREDFGGAALVALGTALLLRRRRAEEKLS